MSGLSQLLAPVLIKNHRLKKIDRAKKKKVFKKKLNQRAANFNLPRGGNIA